MWKFVKMLEYPVNIKKKDLRMAKYIITQYGGPYGELGAALRYFNQRYTMPDEKGKALLTDIATEELGHVEMICAMVNQLTKGATIKEMEEANLKKAIKEYERYVESKQPKDAPYKRLCVLYRKENDYDNEVRVLETACEVFADNEKKLAYFEKRLAKLK